MIDKTFVDTNILVYARDASCPAKQKIAYDLLGGLWRNRSGRLSVQVCNEYYVTVTRKLKPGLNETDAWRDLELYEAWDPLPMDVRTLRKAREVQLRYALSWWDALIIASAYFSECCLVVSEDLNPGQDYFGIRIVNPFAGIKE
jgi:predicted nucleic acid-binding protein